MYWTICKVKKCNWKNNISKYQKSSKWLKEGKLKYFVVLLKFVSFRTRKFLWAKFVWVDLTSFQETIFIRTNNPSVCVCVRASACVRVQVCVCVRPKTLSFSISPTQNQSPDRNVYFGLRTAKWTCCWEIIWATIFFLVNGVSNAW